MKIKSVHAVITAAAALFCGTALSVAADPSKEDAAFASKLIAAHENINYEAVVAAGLPLKKEQFEAVAAKFAPRLKAGHEIFYLGALSQRGNRVTLWKISFKDGGDDLLVTLSVKDGRVMGLLLR